MIKVGAYSHLPLIDQLSFIKLLMFCDGLNCLRKFEHSIEEILNA